MYPVTFPCLFLSIHLSAHNNLRTSEQVFMKFGTGQVTIRQQYQTHYMKAYLRSLISKTQMSTFTRTEQWANVHDTDSGTGYSCCSQILVIPGTVDEIFAIVCFMYVLSVYVGVIKTQFLSKFCVCVFANKILTRVSVRISVTG